MGKNIENHAKPTISSPKKATNIPVVTFKWDFRTPPPFPNLGGAKPGMPSKVVPSSES